MRKKSFGNIMKTALLSMAGICLVLLGGCTDTPTKQEDGRIQILCTTFPLYDWTRQIIQGQEEELEVSLLIDGGTDLHNYQPTAEDILKITEADIVIYVGGESDRWMEDVISAVPKDVRSGQQYLNLMETLSSSLLEEEYVEGMEREGEAEDVTAGEQNTALEILEETAEYDEHIWLSLKNAANCVQAIETAVISEQLEESVRKTVTENTDYYVKELNALDQAYGAMVQEAFRRTLVVADRFPFLYLMKDYGLEYYAAFPGCSAESEASFETVIFLADKLDEYDLPAVLVMENGNDQIAETVVENTLHKDQEILMLDSLQSVSDADISQGTTYLSVMRENLSVLREALESAMPE